MCISFIMLRALCKFLQGVRLNVWRSEVGRKNLYYIRLRQNIGVARVRQFCNYRIDTRPTLKWLAPI